MAEDTNNSGKKWKDLKNMNNKEEIDVDKAWNNVHSRLIENGLEISESPVRIRFMRTTIHENCSSCSYFIKSRSCCHLYE